MDKYLFIVCSLCYLNKVQGSVKKKSNSCSKSSAPKSQQDIRVPLGGVSVVSFVIINNNLYIWYNIIIQCMRKGHQFRSWSSWGQNCWYGHLDPILHKMHYFPKYDRICQKMPQKWPKNYILKFWGYLGNGIIWQSCHNEY